MAGLFAAFAYSVVPGLARSSDRTFVETIRIKNLAAARKGFEDSWVAWNIVRALLHTAAFGCLLWALIVFGTHRSQETTTAAPPALRPLAATAQHDSLMDAPLAPMAQAGLMPRGPQARGTGGPRW
ncbi:hypothetical protein [Streptomyces sp. NPDC021020]|uniref:hypothetical protein n=1 Tax=Streptomyces sp. NPDC021020 TaxID=3365109 RepID=UPI0037AC1AC0